MAARWVRACSLDSLDRHRITAVTLEGRQLIIIRDEDRLFATERACPHEGADLLQGRCAGGRLHCPRHLAWFDLISGAISPGWPSRALDVYPLRLEGDQIYLDMAREGSDT